MAPRQRLDISLVDRGLVQSREKAQALILAGHVTVDGQKAQKAGQPVSPEAQISVVEPLRYVSRGGLKLEAALREFGLSVGDKVCLDVGTSTGGFADCLLQHGARTVHCVDTGAGQIDWKLRTNPNVRLHERTNARYLKPEDIAEQVEIIACDVSFISVTLLLPALARLLQPAGDWIILVKPQFEVGKAQVGKGGIVRDPALHALACNRVQSALEELGFSARITDSPILGTEGNREFLLHARRLNAS